MSGSRGSDIKYKVENLATVVGKMLPGSSLVLGADMEAILDEQVLEGFFDSVQDAEDAVGAKCHDIEDEEDESGFSLSEDDDANVDANEFGSSFSFAP